MTTQLNGDEHNTPQQQPNNDLESNVSLLSTLLSQTQAVDEQNPEDVAELLGQLETATGIAMGVEDKLDGIIGHLDNLLNALEAAGCDDSPPQQAQEPEQTGSDVLSHNLDAVKKEDS